MKLIKAGEQHTDCAKYAKLFKIHQNTLTLFSRDNIHCAV